MLYVGIDPGKTGGYAAVDEFGYCQSLGRFSNWKEIGITLCQIKGEQCVVALEQVSAMRGQGVSSMFSFGANYGGWMALLDYLEVPYVLVPPQRWQKKILGIFPKGESKVRAFEYTRRRFPDLKLAKKDKGIIDSLCIALYIRENH